MRHILQSALLVFCSMFSLNSFADHWRGFQMEYECVSSCTLRVNWSWYRDCSGAAAAYANINFSSDSSGCTAPTAINALSIVSAIEITPVCPGYPTRCTSTNANLSGVQLITLSQDFNYCAASHCDFDINFATCCRNSAITSIVSPGGYGNFLRTGPFNPGETPCNSAPRWNSPPQIYLCNEESQEAYQGAIDWDGDSIVYALDTCRTFGGTPLNYMPGFTPSQPMGPNWNIDLDPRTGIIKFNKIYGGWEVGVICLMAKQYRNGQYIGQVTRDMQVSVVGCQGNLAPIISDPQNLMGGGRISNDTLFVCEGDSVCFDIGAIDPNAGDSVLLSWRQLYPGASFRDVSNPAIQNQLSGLSPEGKFCFRAHQAGIYHALFEAKDNNCLIIGKRDKAITFVVSSTAQTFTEIHPNCLEATFSGSRCGSSGFTYQWSGTGGVSANPANNQADFTHQFSAPGTYTWQLIVSSGGVPVDTVNGSVTVSPMNTPMPGLISGNTPIPCTGPITLTAASGYGGYLWSTGATTASISVSNPGTYSLTTTDSLGCTYTDNVLVNPDPTRDISGTITTSTGAPLIAQPVMLITYDSANGGTLIPGNIAYTDANGLFEFCQVADSLVNVKVIPSASVYPNQMPSYADTTVFWNEAMRYGMSSFPSILNFSTTYGASPGGTGLIGGIITEGINKVNAPGDPVSNQIVFIREAGTRNYLGYTFTDVNGYFQFSNLPVGSYEIAVDKPHVDEDNVPMVPLSAGLAQRDSLDFRLHSTYLEWVQLTGLTEPAASDFSLSPNPTSGVLNISFEGNSEGRIELVSVDGRVLYQAEIQQNLHRINLKALGLSEGFYFFRGISESGVQTRKVIFSR